MLGTVSTYGTTLQTSRTEGRDGEVLIARDGHIYKLAGILGKGGLSTVYRAIRFSDGEVLALKIADTDKAEEAGILLRKEAAILKRMDNTHIVKITDQGETRDGDPFIVMDLLFGQTLEQVLAEVNTLPLHRAASICLQVAAALEYAHKNGVIHKDIKPSNIMILDDDGEDHVILYDFGIAMTVEATGVANEQSSSGSLLYAAPEQLTETPCSYSTDVYQLALVLFEALTGRLPFEMTVAGAVKYRKGGPVLVDNSELGEHALGEHIRKVLESALQRNPEVRTATMKSFSDSLYEAVVDFGNSLTMSPSVCFA
jgi:eukaryotic-like serine/threonine-protein kinase